MSVTTNKQLFLGVDRSLLRDPRTWLLILAITEKNIFRYLMLALTMATGNDGIGDFILHASYIILIILCIKRGSRLRNADIFIMLVVVAAIFLTWILYPANIEQYMFGEDQFWPVVFPLFRYFIVGLFLIPNEDTVNLMGKVSCLSVLVESLFVYFILRRSELQQNDDMSRAYFILLNVLLVINYTFDNKTIPGIIFSIIGTLFLVSMGTRGPVVITLAFVGLKIVQSSMNKGRGAIALIAILALIWFVNSELWTGFLLMVKDIIESLGLSTRVIDFAIQGDTLTYYSERDEIAELVISKIQEHPILGWGVYGEWQFCGWSAHNMYLEILDHYGVILGGIILIWMATISLKAYISSKYSPAQGLVLLFVCFTFVRGIFGGGFLTFQTFFMIGFFLQVIRKTSFNYLT